MGLAVAALLLFLWFRPKWGAVALVVMPAAILMVAIGLFSNPEIQELPPTLRSIWLIFHITFAKLSAARYKKSKSPGMGEEFLIASPDITGSVLVPVRRMMVLEAEELPLPAPRSTFQIRFTVSFR